MRRDGSLKEILDILASRRRDIGDAWISARRDNAGRQTDGRSRAMSRYIERRRKSHLGGPIARELAPARDYCTSERISRWTRIHFCPFQWRSWSAWPPGRRAVAVTWSADYITATRRAMRIDTDASSTRRPARRCRIT